MNTKMQNGVVIRGVEYELVVDLNPRWCDRCALSKQCHNGEDLICDLIFTTIAINCRFERKQKST